MIFKIIFGIVVIAWSIAAMIVLAIAFSIIRVMIRRKNERCQDIRSNEHKGSRKKEG